MSRMWLCALLLVAGVPGCLESNPQPMPAGGGTEHPGKTEDAADKAPPIAADACFAADMAVPGSEDGADCAASELPAETTGEEVEVRFDVADAAEVQDQVGDEASPEEGGEVPPDIAGDTAADVSVETAGETDTGGAPCGDPDKYKDCVWDLSEADCLAAGGKWGQWGLSPIPSCMCPSGDGGCPCDSGDDCVGLCYVPLDGDCAGYTEGVCSDTKMMFGCWCIFGQEGEPAMGICID